MSKTSSPSGGEAADGAAESRDQAIRLGVQHHSDEELTLDLNRILPGRAAIFGKSGSGKSNSIGTVTERLLAQNLAFLIVDADGEHYALKEAYEVLHVGATDACDYQLVAEEFDQEVAQRLAQLVLEENVPIVLDVSGIIDKSDQRRIVADVAKALFNAQQDDPNPRPTPLTVEEAHEYIPQQGATTECAKMLMTVAKRGRKHGLGLWVASQRPANVDKDVITQADWLLWHRLTWENDTNVVRKHLGKRYEEQITDLATGTAFVQLDWTEVDVLQIEVDKKQTFDAGATPELGDTERPDPKSIDEAVLTGLESATSQVTKRRSRIERLEDQLAEREEEIERLEAQLEHERELNAVAQQVGESLFDSLDAALGDGAPDLGGMCGEGGVTDESLRRRNDQLRQRVTELETALERKQARLDELEASIGGADPTAVREALSTLETQLGIDDGTWARAAKLREELDGQVETRDDGSGTS